MNSKPIIFVVSNEPISKTSSNGRTMLNMLEQFDNNQIVNFFIHGRPDLERGSFFSISDSEALKWFKSKKLVRVEKNDSIQKNASLLSSKRTNVKLLLREFVWKKKSIWRSVLNCAKTFKPSCIFIFLSNSSFMIKMSMYLSKKLNIPLITFNSEDYYFKKYDFVKATYKINLAHRVLMKDYRNSFRKMINVSAYNFYLTDDLRNMYLSEFPNQKSSTIYNSSVLADYPVTKNENPISKDFVYAGNIGVGRLDELIKIGKFIKECDSSFNFKIYTPQTKPLLLKKLNSSGYLIDMGSVDYKSLLEIMKSCYAIIHVDGTDPYYSMHTIHGFTTKLPDCLSSGNCFIAKVTKKSTLFNYLSKTKSAFVSTDDNETQAIISSIIINNKERMKYVENAIAVAKQNHSITKNSTYFNQIIINIINGE